jgi:hemerythrin-like domain-containing protein
MATQLPSEGAPPAARCDTSGMLVVHRVLRRRFAAMPALVQGVAHGDIERASIVGAHVTEFAEMLHSHHETEDTHLWGLLESRSPSCAVHVEAMRSQHREVAALLMRMEPLLPEWRRTAEPSLRSALVECLDGVNGALGVHLGAEESRILPVAAVTMTQREWDAFGDLGRESVPRARLLVQLGYVLDAIDPGQRHEWMRANLPAPVRGLYAVAGRRRFVGDYRRVFGTEPA